MGLGLLIRVSETHVECEMFLALALACSSFDFNKKTDDSRLKKMFEDQKLLLSLDYIVS